MLVLIVVGLLFNYCDQTHSNELLSSEIRFAFIVKDKLGKDLFFDSEEYNPLDVYYGQPINQNMTKNPIGLAKVVSSEKDGPTMALLDYYLDEGDSIVNSGKQLAPGQLYVYVLNDSVQDVKGDSFRVLMKNVESQYWYKIPIMLIPGKYDTIKVETQLVKRIDYQTYSRDFYDYKIFFNNDFVDHIEYDNENEVRVTFVIDN